jgi:hypothetical protein
MLAAALCGCLPAIDFLGGKVVEAPAGTRGAAWYLRRCTSSAALMDAMPGSCEKVDVRVLRPRGDVVPVPRLAKVGYTWSIGIVVSSTGYSEESIVYGGAGPGDAWTRERYATTTGLAAMRRLARVVADARVVSGPADLAAMAEDAVAVTMESAMDPLLPVAERDGVREVLFLLLGVDPRTVSPYAAVADLSRDLAGDRTGRRWEAAAALARSGVAGVEALAAGLAANDAEVRKAAAAGLAMAGREAAVAVPALVRTLADLRPGVIQWVVTALGEIGPPAADAIPALKRLTGEPGPRTRDRTRDVARRLTGEPVPGSSDRTRHALDRIEGWLP